MKKSEPYFSFNFNGDGGRFVIPHFPDEESEETVAALREPMYLSSAWVLWEQNAMTTYNCRNVVTFRTAQEFWQVWNGIPQPSELLDHKRFMREQPNGQSVAIDAIMIFREGILPEWEDAANAQGGHFQLLLKPSSTPGQVDEYWNNIVLALVGNVLDMGDMVTGVRLVDKLTAKGKVTDAIRLELWYHSKATPQVIQTLKKSVEKCLITRLDGSTGATFKGEGLADVKHETKRK